MAHTLRCFETKKQRSLNISSICHSQARMAFITWSSYFQKFYQKPNHSVTNMYAHPRTITIYLWSVTSEIHTWLKQGFCSECEFLIFPVVFRTQQIYFPWLLKKNVSLEPMSRDNKLAYKGSYRPNVSNQLMSPVHFVAKVCTYKVFNCQISKLRWKTYLIQSVLISSNVPFYLQLFLDILWSEVNRWL